MIRIHDLSVRYGVIEALKSVNLEIGRGECVLLTGPSGGGKSTLVQVISGLIPQAIPAEVNGTVQVAGLDLLQPAPSRPTIAEIAQRVGMVFQNPSSQLFHLHVEDEVAFGLYNLGLPAEQIQNRVEWTLSTLGLKELRKRNPVELSGGQKQRVAIASALAMQPQVLVLDEPTASLDVEGTKSVIAALQDLRQRLGMTILLSEHRLAEVSRLVERVVLLHEGQVFAEGGFAQILGDRQILHRLGLRRPVLEPMESWDALLVPNGRPTAGTTPLITLENITAGYDHHPVVEDINLSLYPGEFSALVGENGAGKSTLALVIAGLLKPYQGHLRFLGGQKPRPGRDVALLFQNPLEQLFTDTVDEEVGFGPHNYRAFDLLYHEDVLEKSDLLPFRHRHPTALSVGQQQRTALAACLALRPKLLILDEPTLGQDWGHLERLMDFLTVLNHQGTTILLITHDYKLVHRYAERVILMEKGRIILDGRRRPEGESDHEPS